MRLTITFGYNLSNSLQTVGVISHFENRDSAGFSEEVLDATLRTSATVDRSLWVILQRESELLNEVVENMLVASWLR
jgi:hypothetical protein